VGEPSSVIVQRNDPPTAGRVRISKGGMDGRNHRGRRWWVVPFQIPELPVAACVILASGPLGGACGCPR
jgi:hypothetical protein